MAGSRGAVGSRSGDVSRDSSPVGAVSPRSENTVSKTACPWIPKTGRYSPLSPEIPGKPLCIYGKQLLGGALCCWIRIANISVNSQFST